MGVGQIVPIHKKYLGAAPAPTHFPPRRVGLSLLAAFSRKAYTSSNMPLYPSAMGMLACEEAQCPLLLV